MITIRLLPFFINITIKIAGRENAESLLNILTKEEHFFSVDSIYDYEKKKTVTRLTLLLPGKGCAWAKKTGGCTMCGFSQKIKQIGKKFTPKDLIILYKIAELLTIDKKPVSLMIYNAGSYINDNEISAEVQNEICRRVKIHPTIEKLLIETRAEFVTDEKIKNLKNILGSKKLIVAIGLEAQDDKIRNTYIHKGLSKEVYERAIKIIKKNDALSLTYIFIKPIYLNESESIKEAIKTAEYAFKTGSDEVAFESAFVQKGTLMEKLYNEGEFTPPWLWSIIEVLRKTNHLGPIHAGGFQDEPPPIAIPSNCNKCSEKIREALNTYRKSYDFNILNTLYCDCKKEWESIVKL